MKTYEWSIFSKTVIFFIFTILTFTFYFTGKIKVSAIKTFSTAWQFSAFTSQFHKNRKKIRTHNYHQEIKLFHIIFFFEVVKLLYCRDVSMQDDMHKL